MLISIGTNNKWTYDLMDHLMTNLEILIALVSMAYNVDLDDYKLHLGDENVFNDFINECLGFTLYEFFKSKFVYSC